MGKIQTLHYSMTGQNKSGSNEEIESPVVTSRTTRHNIELRSPDLLRGEQWQFLTYGSEQPIGPIFLNPLGPIGSPDKSVRNYHCSPRNNPEECSSQLMNGGSPK